MLDNGIYSNDSIALASNVIYGGSDISKALAGVAKIRKDFVTFANWHDTE